MSLRNRLSKSSGKSEEKDQGNPTKESLEAPSNGEALKCF